MTTANNRAARPGGARGGILERFRWRAAAIAMLDLMGLDALPGRRWGPIAVAVAAVLVFSGGHLLIADVWTESLPFMLIALAIGFLSRTVAIGMLLLHVVVDLVRYLAFPGQSSYVEVGPESFAGRVISWWLLWLLIVTIPTAQRAVTAAIAERPRATESHRLAGAVAGAALAGLLVFLWSNAQPYMIRAFFIGSPTVPAMLPQQIPFLLAGAAAAIALVVVIVRQRLVPENGDSIPLFLVGGTGPTATLTRIGLYAVSMILVLGLVTSVIDVVLLGAALVAGEVVAPRLGTLSGYRATLGRVHPLIRFVVAIVATFVIGQLVTALWYQPLLGSEFFPIVLSLALGLLVFRLLLADLMTPIARSTIRPAGTGTVAALALFAAAIVTLASPGPASADNCSGLSDCASLLWAQVGAAVSAIAAFLWAMITGIFEKTPPVISTLEALASEEGAEAQQGAFNMLQNRVATEALANGDADEYYRIKSLTTAEFYQEAQTGKWDRASGGGISVSGSRGCLPPRTPIETPSGPLAVEDIRPGMRIWTLAPDGRHRGDVVAAVGGADTSASHEMVAVTLEDGRTVRASATHPLADGRDIGWLAVGDVVDGSRVIGVSTETYLEGRTYDILPASGAAYWAGGVPLLSTLIPIQEDRQPALAGVSGDSAA